MDLVLFGESIFHVLIKVQLFAYSTNSSRREHLLIPISAYKVLDLWERIIFVGLELFVD